MKKIYSVIRVALMITTIWLSALGSAFFIMLNCSSWWVDLRSSYLTNVPTQHQLADYWRVIRYLQLPWVHELRFEYLKMGSSAIHHFRDVRGLVLGAEFWLIISFLVAVGLLWYQKRTFQLWKLKSPLRWSFIIVILLLGMGITNFDQTFIEFHQLVFNNHDWIFNVYTDQIINMLPISFFLTCSLIWFALTFIFVFLIYWWINHQLKLFADQFAPKITDQSRD